MMMQMINIKYNILNYRINRFKREVEELCDILEKEDINIVKKKANKLKERSIKLSTIIKKYENEIMLTYNKTSSTQADFIKKRNKLLELSKLLKESM